MRTTLLDRELPAPPGWAQQMPGVIHAKQLDRDPAGEWLILRLMAEHLAVSICTLSPTASCTEQWDYPIGPIGAADAMRAYKRWPHRDHHTEAWTQHTSLQPGVEIVRRNPRTEDVEEPR